MVKTYVAVVAGSKKFIILPAHGIELSALGLVFSWPASFNHST